MKANIKLVFTLVAVLCVAWIAWRFYPGPEPSSTGGGASVAETPAATAAEAVTSPIAHTQPEGELAPKAAAQTVLSTPRADGEGAATGFSILPRAEGDFADPLLGLSLALTPRQAHPPAPLHLPPGEVHEIQIKFIDEVSARVEADNQVALNSGDREAIQAITDLAVQNGLSIERNFDDPDSIEMIRERAARKSGNMQADLNATMRVSGVQGQTVLEVAQLLQASALIESVDILSLDMPPPPPADIAPTTPDLVANQTHLGSNPGFGVEHIWNLGVKGAGVKFTDCEYGYHPNHEDLVDSGITDLSPAAIEPEVAANGWDDHGTAALGITCAGHNGYGVNGIAPDATIQFSSEWTVNGYNRSSAISRAIAQSQDGDVILLEMQATGGQGGFGPAEYSSSVWNLTKTATDSGIIVVAAAGNGGEDMDSAEYQAYRDRGDSGAIIVGAGSSNTTHSRLSYSTFGSRVDVQAWGQSVLTTGYGGYANYGSDDLQTYSRFSGTSSASACVGGLATLFQSYAKATYQSVFTPIEMRQYFKRFGHAQGGSGGLIGPAVALDLVEAALPDDPSYIEIQTSPNLQLDYRLQPSTSSFKIQYSADQSTWVDLVPSLIGTDTVDISAHPDSADQRYYRVQSSSAP